MTLSFSHLLFPYLIYRVFFNKKIDRDTVDYEIQSN